jgi:hypothetical protein
MIVALDTQPPGRHSLACKRICADDRAALMQHSLSGLVALSHEWQREKTRLQCCHRR